MLRAHRFPYDYKATHFLASPQQKTPWPVFQDGQCNTSPTSPYYNVTADSFGRIHSLHAAFGCHYLVSGTFHPPIGVLFSFPSRYFYSIGLETYLELGVDASHIQTRYPTDPTQEKNIHKPLHQISTGLSPSTVLKFQINFNLKQKGSTINLYTTSPTIYKAGFSLLLIRFRSPLLTKSHIAFFSSTY